MTPLISTEYLLTYFTFFILSHRDVREGIIRCILATDMARHNEILTQFQEATPIFDYNNKVHTNLVSIRGFIHDFSTERQ